MKTPCPHGLNAKIWEACENALDEIMDRQKNHPDSIYDKRDQLIAVLHDNFVTRSATWGHAHDDFEDTPESAWEKISRGWSGHNNYPATDGFVIGFGGSSYLALSPDGTYSYYETAT